MGDVDPKSLHSFVELKCTVKHRFSDFIVNEIDPSGEVVWFKPETDLQKWKKVNIEHTMPGMEYQPQPEPEIIEVVKEPVK
jgi:hypothetical protein